jgi:anti-sigma factor RsiW
MDVLTCYRTRRRLDALVDGALGERQLRLASAHVVDCPRCRREADELRRLRTLVRQSLAVAAPGDWTGFWPGIVRGIEGQRHAPLPAPAPGVRRLLGRSRLALGGAIAAMLVASLAIWQFWAGAPADLESAVVVNSARTETPGISLMVYSPPERDMAVVWMLAADDGDGEE